MMVGAVCLLADESDLSSSPSVLLLQFTVEPYLSGVRVDSFLAKHLRNYTAWRLHRMVAEGLVTVDCIPADRTQRLFRGQQVTVRVVEPPDRLLPPHGTNLDIVYEDPWLMVIDKPAGMVAHPVGEFQQATLSNAVQAHLDQQTKAPGLLRPGIVHRLDRMTSGLIVVTKDHLSHRYLSLDFQKGDTTKSYWALVAGNPEFESLRIDCPIGQRPGHNSVLMSTAPDARRPRTARTDVRVMRQLTACALVECDLHTGRNHQIRVHLAHVGHPVLGDEYYGAYGAIHKAPRFDGEAPTDIRHALHAGRLGFRHPIFQTSLEFQSVPPVDFWDTPVDLSVM